MKTLDKSRPFSVVYDQADHAFEQDGRLFDRKGNQLEAGSSPLPGPVTTAIDPASTKTTDPTDDQGEQDAPPSANVPSLGLGTKVENALLGAGITTVDQLCLATKDELLALPNIGEAAVKEIVKKLKAANKKLAG